MRCLFIFNMISVQSKKNRKMPIKCKRAVLFVQRLQEIARGHRQAAANNNFIGTPQTERGTQLSARTQEEQMNKRENKTSKG